MCCRGQVPHAADWRAPHPESGRGRQVQELPVPGCQQTHGLHSAQRGTSQVLSLRYGL